MLKTKKLKNHPKNISFWLFTKAYKEKNNIEFFNKIWKSKINGACALKISKSASILVNLLQGEDDPILIAKKN